MGAIKNGQGSSRQDKHKFQPVLEILQSVQQFQEGYRNTKEYRAYCRQKHIKHSENDCPGLARDNTGSAHRYRQLEKVQGINEEPSCPAIFCRISKGRAKNPFPNGRKAVR